MATGLAPIVATMGIGAGCSSPSADQKAISAYQKATAEMKALCVRDHAPTEVVTAVAVPTAVEELQSAHMSTAPWSSLSPDAVIVQCGSGTPRTGAVLIDGCGRRSAAPPPTTTATVPCQTAVCSYFLTVPVFPVTKC